MMKKESFRRILIRIFWISLVFTIGFSWVYIRYAVPDRLNLVVNEEEVFHFALPPGVTFESDSEEVVLKNASEIPQGMIRIERGYYVHLQPDGSMLAGGSLCLPTNILKAVRQSIYDNIEEFVAIVEDPEFKKYFPVIGEDFLKTAPKGFPKDFKYIDYLKCKEYVCSYNVPDDFFTRPDMLEQIDKVFRQFKRFADFINYTIDDFE